ncbi:MAG: GtrA family protein [Nitrososphaerota archaeon]|nr:GtrA family protein [Nitrososphaerota archaeon]
MPSAKELERVVGKELDFVSVASLGCDKISMQYARHLVTSRENPSVANALENGFSTTMSIVEIIMSPRNFLRMYSKIFKFGLVGASGIVVNLAVLTLLKGVIPILAANIIAQELSIINNFTWNDRFTFNFGGVNNRLFTTPRLYRFVKYNLVSLFSLAVNELVFYLAYYQSHLQFVTGNYIASSLIAIFVAFMINYLGSSRWAWGKAFHLPLKD